MVDAKEARVLKYVKTYKAKGYTNGQIKSALVKSGVDSGTINKVMSSVGGASWYSNKVLWATIAAIVILLFAILAVLTFLPDDGEVVDTEIEEAECESDSDCRTGYECSVRGECEYAGEELECSSANDCSSGEECVDGVCEQEKVEEVECDYDVDCEENYSCDGGECVLEEEDESGEECSDVVDCEEGYTCEDTYCVIDDASSGGSSGDELFSSPNLIVSSAETDSLTVETAVIAATVENEGGKSAESTFTVACLVVDADGNEYAGAVETTDEDFEVGETETVNCEVDVSSLYASLAIGRNAEVNIIVTADSENVVDESEEDNNEFSYEDSWNREAFNVVEVGGDACANDGDCSAYVCDVENAVCRVDCDDGSGVADQTLCAEGYVCDESSLECHVLETVVLEVCSEDADCEGYLCEEGVCTTSCEAEESSEFSSVASTLSGVSVTTSVEEDLSDDDLCDEGYYCSDEFTCEETGLACSDGLDNDGDGRVDYGEDRGCSSLFDDNEANVCLDGLDNDEDGFTDLNDPECSSPADQTEDIEETRCSDGWDNDGDGYVDWSGICLIDNGNWFACGDLDEEEEVEEEVEELSCESAEVMLEIGGDKYSISGIDDQTRKVSYVSIQPDGSSVLMQVNAQQEGIIIGESETVKNVTIEVVEANETAGDFILTWNCGKEESSAFASVKEGGVTNGITGNFEIIEIISGSEVSVNILDLENALGGDSEVSSSNCQEVCEDTYSGKYFQADAACVAADDSLALTLSPSADDERGEGDLGVSLAPSEEESLWQRFWSFLFGSKPSSSLDYFSDIRG